MYRIFLILFCATLLPTSSLLAASQRSLEIPATAAGEQLRWVLEQVNAAGPDLSEATLNERFASEFLVDLPPSQLAAVFRNYLMPSAPMQIVRFEGGATDRHANALLQSSTGLWRVTLDADPISDNQISALFFEPVALISPSANTAVDWSALKGQFDRLAPETSFIAAEIIDGACLPIARVHSEQSLAIASMFKLYVLGELSRQVAANQAAWDEPLALSPEFISQPNGEMKYKPLGQEFPLVHYAEQMISKSDNTATDHLIGRLGRESVEQAFATMGQQLPERNAPLIMTREWFAMKMRFSDADLGRYAEADIEDRRQILTEKAAPLAPTLLETEPWSPFRALDSVEWFASAGDICRAFAYLQQAGMEPENASVLDTLSIEPALILDPADWSYVGYKGGYETGVLSHSWLLQRTDGRWFTIAGIANDPSTDINGAAMTQLMIDAIDLLSAA